MLLCFCSVIDHSDVKNVVLKNKKLARKPLFECVTEGLYGILTSSVICH